MDLNLDHQYVIFRVLWGTNRGDGRKLCVAIQGGVSALGSSRFLKSSQISIGHESATDIVAEAMNISALILDGERDSSTERAIPEQYRILPSSCQQKGQCAVDPHH